MDNIDHAIVTKCVRSNNSVCTKGGQSSCAAFQNNSYGIKTYIYMNIERFYFPVAATTDITVGAGATFITIFIGVSM